MHSTGENYSNAETLTVMWGEAETTENAIWRFTSGKPGYSDEITGLDSVSARERNLNSEGVYGRVLQLVRCHHL